MQGWVSGEAKPSLRWEYASRSGTATKWWTGDTEVRVRAKENIGGMILPVGSKSPNGFGLFDMAGNSWEWCLDPYGTFGTERNGDGLRHVLGYGLADHCVRGGGYSQQEQFIFRDRYNRRPTERLMGLGLRAARTSRL